MKTTSRKESEEAFLTLLQRIQRQYNPPTANPTKQHLMEEAATAVVIPAIVSQRPPDEAAVAMGRQLASKFQDLGEEIETEASMDDGSARSGGSHLATRVIPKGMQEKALQGLVNRYVNPSVVVSFLHTLLWNSPQNVRVSMEWLPAWIFHAEQVTMEDGKEASYHALTTMVRTYCHSLILQNQPPQLSLTTGRRNDANVATTFRRLQTSPARMAMIRELTHVAFTTRTASSHSSKQVEQLLSPLVAACVLNLPTPTSEATLFMECLWRECWAEITQWPDEDFLATLQWMSRSLNIFLSGLPCTTGNDQVSWIIAGKELAMRWLVHLLELAGVLSQSGPEQQPMLASWLSELIASTVPCLAATCPSYQISFEPALDQVIMILQNLDAHNQPFRLDTVATLRLSTVLLSSPLPLDVHAMLKVLLHAAAPPNAPASLSAQAVLRGVASMLVRDQQCQNTSQEIIQTLAKSRLPNSKSTSNTMKKVKAARGSLGQVVNVIQFLDESIVDVNNFVTFLARANSLVGTQCSAIQQTGLLLFGIGLLMDNAKHQDAAYTFLGNLLEVYPHLGVPLLPVLVDCINAACVQGDGVTMLRQLDFLCDAVVKDTQCAREIWNLLGVELMSVTTPTVIRANVIRLFPKLCRANKRLYKRVIEALGNILATSSHIWEIRLAVAATIADLAKEDRIRDVTDVIGWIQSFISDTGWVHPVSNMDKENTPQNAALVHFAIASLHYLVVAQELDFPLVITVLNKRLCNVHDMKEVDKLPIVAVETLVLLLGDGEVDDDEEDDDADEESTLHPVGRSSQVSNSVETLISLALSPRVHPSSAADDSMLRLSLLRCRRNVYDSLARYSMEALGIDDFGVQAITAAANDDEAPAPPPTGERYSVVRHIIEDGVSLLENGELNMDATPNDKDTVIPEDEMDSNASSSLGAIIAKMLKFEEDVLGSTLWQKRGRKKGAKKKFVKGQATVNPTQVQALPAPPNVQKIYRENPCTATSLASMLCFDGKPLSLFGDLAGDVIHESDDPLIRAFTVQAWLNAARSTLMELVVSLSNSEGLENALLDIREWRFRLDCPDNMYMALGSLALMIPDILGPYGDHSPYVEDICEEVWTGYTAHEFENPDIGKLCLGFIGVCSVRNRSMQRVDEIVEILEKSVLGYGGQASFGAYYSLAIIAQACPSLFDKDDEGADGDDLGLIGRIVGFLVNELVLCIAGDHSALSSLVACIRNGEIIPEVIDTVTALGKKPLKMVKAKKQTAKSLFISLAVCLPALASSNDELLLGVYCLLESLPWGYGKGMALSSVLHACRRCGLFQGREVEKIYPKYAKIFEEGMDKGVDGLDDIFYAVTATMTKTIPYSIRRFLVGNRTLFDEDGRAVSLLAAVVSLSSLPCLGCGATSFTDSAQLSKKASTEDIDGVKTLISEAVSGKEWTKYSQVAVLLMGFLASMNNFAEVGDPSSHVRKAPPAVAEEIGNDPKAGQLPLAQPGTVLEVVMSALAQMFYEPNVEMDEKETNVLVTLLGCLEVLSLPGHFASFLEFMFRGRDEAKTACTKLLISQIRGRPRAVFDGREYIDLALRMTKMPVTSIKTVLGQGEAPTIFIEALIDLLPKFSSDSSEEVVENFWRLCINQVGTLPRMSVSFLSAMKELVKSSGDKKSFITSPKTLNFLRGFLVTRVFAGIRDAPWTTTATSATFEERSMVDMYAKCLLELPISSLVDAEFFTLKELDGFVGEALRYRCVMILVQNGYFTTPSRSSSEISSAIAWFSRQLTSSTDEIFSSTLLQVACSIAGATSGENADRRRELLLTLLDNLLLTGSSASYVGLQMLAVLVCHWTHGSGSDGELSLVSIMSTQMERWQELSPPTLQQTFRILVHDLPFNLATYARSENMSGVVFNRLWRVYNKWWEQGADQATIDCVRKSLICCRSAESGGEDFAFLATSMLL